MRIWIFVAALGLTSPACGNEYHPEYHPQTAVRYTVSTSNPVHVQGTQGQPVYVGPQPGQAQTAQAPAGQIVVPAPPAPPTPPEGWPW